MKEVDPIRIRDLLGNMNDALRRLRELGDVPEEAFLADYRNTESAKYLLIVAMESAIDSCNHIVARKGGGRRRIMPTALRFLPSLRLLTRNWLHASGRWHGFEISLSIFTGR
ncbi:MAG: HepT-like ribonuclease domain-containing protein [Thermodesulfobacteriota bacterium]|nr:HepT-like ribonuclease domain-containing protein [Thermodesulfobacteriota bacterium]